MVGDMMNASKNMNALLDHPQMKQFLTNLDSAHFYQYASHQFDTTFMGCIYPGIQESIFNCDMPDGLFAPVKTQMGMCYTFNPLSYINKTGDRIQVTKAGKSGGLTLLLNVGQKHYMLGGFSAGMKVSSEGQRSVIEVSHRGQS